MPELDNFKLVAMLRNLARPVTGLSSDYNMLMDLIGDSRLVLLGEASHGTHEFYSERARITKRLIEEKEFKIVAVEADWPDAYRVNRYVRGISEDNTATDALSGFERFPSWMWRNKDVLDFIIWLKKHNDEKVFNSQKTGFYGLDLYSLFRSIEAVIDYLDKVDPEAAKRAHYRYSCFEHFGEDPQAYGYATRFNLNKSCEDEVVIQLVELRRKALEYAWRDGRIQEDDFFCAEQNAQVVLNSERYYRAMFEGRNVSWNLRDTHMAETLDSILKYFDEKTGQPAKIVVWAHNSHIGDASATEIGETGELNLGQLVCQKYGKEAFLVGFTTFTGTVTAASNWNFPEERKRIKPAFSDSYEALFNKTGIHNFWIPLKTNTDLYEALQQPRLERAIGVIYHPDTERISHYFYSRLSEQFDAVIHLDQTHAVEPLEPSEHWETSELPETFPSGL